MRKVTLLIFLSVNFLVAQTTHNYSWTMQSTNQQITIEAGDTVVWTWGSGTHNLRSTSGTESFDSGYFGSGYQFSHTFNQQGVTNYTCDPHSSMYGTVTVTASMSVSDSNILSMRVYPNPVITNHVTIETSLTGIKKIELFDLNGKTVLKTSINTNKLDVTQIDSGVYFLKVSVNQKSTTSKLIIQ